MTIKSPFQPRYGAKQTIAPGAASATITIGKGNKTLRVRNTGATNEMQFRTYLSTDPNPPAATVADMPVEAGVTVYIEKPQDHDTMAFISAAGTTATVIPGEGGGGSGN